MTTKTKAKTKKRKQALGPLQREWLRCLRDPEWKQVTGALCREVDGEVGYCCLGIACEVAAVNGVKVEHRFDIRGVKWAFDGETKILPKNVREALRFRSRYGDIADLDWYECLAEANDGGKTFAEIADFVEAHPEAVFERPA